MLAGGCATSNETETPSDRSFSTLENIVANIPLNVQATRLAAVTLSDGGEVRIRHASAPPLVIVDGTPIEVGTGDLSFLNPAEVVRIEVITGPDKVIYGQRGSYGVLKITTKHQAAINSQ